MALALVALTPVAALAHANLVASDASGGFVTLAFSEPVQPIGQAVRVYAPDGRRVDRGRVTRPGPASLRVAFEGSREGTYLVVWQVVSSDTHPSRGTLTFAIGTPGPTPVVGVASGDVGGVSLLGLVLQTLARWLRFLGIALGFGAPFAALVAGLAGSRRIARLALVGAVLLFAGELAWVFGAAASLGTWDEQSLADIVASPGGRVMGLLMGAALGLWALLGIEGRPRARAVAIAALGVAVCAVDGGSGHVVRDAPAFATVLLNGLHEAAMAGWVGGVAAVVIGAVAARAALPVAVAGATVGVVSGGILALVHIPEVTLLVRSDYGRALVLKLFVVGAAVLLGAVAWRRRRPEAIALLAVLAAAGLLASLPPPR